MRCDLASSYHRVAGMPAWLRHAAGGNLRLDGRKCSSAADEIIAEAGRRAYGVMTSLATTHA